MSDNNEQENTQKDDKEEPAISDRLQYLIGALISIVMVVIYLIVTGGGDR